MDRVFYASGRRGKEVRADGNGSVLARGWYGVRALRRGVSGGRFGPFKTKTEANFAAFGTFREPRA